MGYENTATADCLYCLRKSTGGTWCKFNALMTELFCTFSIGFLENSLICKMLSLKDIPVEASRVL